MTRNKRWKRKVRKFAAAKGISHASAHRQLTGAPDHEPVDKRIVDLTAGMRGGVDKTSSTGPMPSRLPGIRQPVIIDIDRGAHAMGPDQQFSPLSTPGLLMSHAKGGGSKPPFHAGDLTAAVAQVAARPIFLDPVSPELLATVDAALAEQATTEEGATAQKPVERFLITWLVRASGSHEPQAITQWMRRHGRLLTPHQHAALTSLLIITTPDTTTDTPVDDPEQYLDNVTALLAEHAMTNP